MLQSTIHYSLHFLAPGLLAFIFFRSIWMKAWAIMLMSMAIDLDHLLATPIFEPGRCSIGFHPLHTWPAMLLYVGMLLYPNKIVRALAVGLLFHMVTDFIDCLWTFKNCSGCCEGSNISWICDVWLTF